MNRYLLGKILDVFTEINIFLTNPNDNLKNRYYFKLIIDHATINFVLEIFFLLNNFIS